VASFEISEVVGLTQELERLREQIAGLSEDRWLSAKEAAEHIRCDVRRVYDLTSAHRIPVHKEGARNLYLRSELDEWVRNGGRK
jgi:excisionase family DNA binding protein